MAETESPAKGKGKANGNGKGSGSDVVVNPEAAGNPDAAMFQEPPQVSIRAQYVKDLSVENPSAPQVFQWDTQPQLEVQFNITVDKVDDQSHEVGLKITVAARSQNGTHFVIDLTYACVIAVSGVPEDALAPFLLIEAPRLVFPFARQIIAEAVTNVGFPPFYLDPIDFAGAYMAQVEALNAEQGGNGGEPAPAA